MGETENISKMAEKLSSELFNVFLWEKVGPTNVNWPCLNKDHGKKTHPTDIVFTYKEPYMSKRMYLNCDLKSYAKGTINTGTVRTALQSLSQTIDCAACSKEWNDKYKYYKDNYTINGLLFIYNHDGEYDKDFDTILDALKNDDLNIPKGRKIFVLGPRDICFLATVTMDIIALRGLKKLPDEDRCNFYFPDLVEKRANSLEHMSATIEMLTSPYITMKYKKNDKTGIQLYYRRKGSSVDEFLYLFDFLFHYQQLQECDEIFLSLYEPAGDAAALFEKAKNIYSDERDNKNEIMAILGKIQYRSLTSIIKRFSEIEIGMGYNG